MHRKILTSGIAMGFALAIGACEKHDWEKTQTLHQPHHGHGDHGAHGDGHGDHHHGDEEDHHDEHGEDHSGHDDHHGDAAKKGEKDDHGAADHGHAEKEKKPAEAKTLGE